MENVGGRHCVNKGMIRTDGEGNRNGRKNMWRTSVNDCADREWSGMGNEKKEKARRRCVWRNR